MPGMTVESVYVVLFLFTWRRNVKAVAELSFLSILKPSSFVELSIQRIEIYSGAGAPFSIKFVGTIGTEIMLVFVSVVWVVVVFVTPLFISLLMVSLLVVVIVGL